jgi:hypothetical protein
MAPLHQHIKDCERLLGAPHEEVHRWIDEFSATVGAKHRKLRHHWEGVGEAERLFGEDGAKAAIVHILRDCRNVPKAADYDSGAADALGLKSAWPVSAYIHYTEEAFHALAKYTLEGPTAVVLWAFFRSKEDVENLLNGLSRVAPQEREKYLQNWETVSTRFAELNQHPLAPASFRGVEGETKKYFERTREVLSSLFRQLPNAQFAMVSVDQLITPLALIDYEYVEQLKATLTGTEPGDVAAFSFPQQLSIQAKAAVDPSGRAVNFISAEKTLALTPLTVTEIPGVGFEIKAAVVGTPQMILVHSVANRLYIINGAHRAYLLASLGMREIPCVLVEANQIPLVTGAYPTFAPHILASPRPPMLMDMFDPTLTLQIPAVRTTKIIRVSTEELILPTD